MSTMRFPTSTDQAREEAVEAASLAVRRGDLVVIPTDTVYGVGADAFDEAAVRALLAAKGRGREKPPPVLVSSPTTLQALASRVSPYAQALVDAFWPGPLTLVCHQQPSLQWDLGETRGTVAVRMPDDPVALAVLERTGPLAVSSANLTGEPAARDADEAERMLGEKVAVVVDAGRTAGAAPSTIVDVTGPRPVVLRWGALGADELNVVLEPLGLAVASPEQVTEPVQPQQQTPEPEQPQEPGAPAERDGD